MVQQAIYEKYGYTENEMGILLVSGSFREIQHKETFVLALGIGSFYPDDPFEKRKDRFKNWIELYKNQDPKIMEAYEITPERVRPARKAKKIDQTHGRI